ncbi:MAG TPA: hypothetical protein VM328_11885 [Fimbriimonadaceae bacterium]|nr:hypothetical protein [Fimbriimonadaceae bacterium]
MLALGGCGCGQLPDPNDPKDVGVLAPDVLRRQLKWASDNLNMRRAKGEITEDQAKSLITSYANDLLAQVDLRKIDPDRAWEYGEVCRTAQRWDMAREALEIAVANPPNEDRRINDTLRLAHVLAKMGQAPKAIETAKKVMDAEPHESAPILPAVLLEIVPAAEKKGHDAPLAALLEQAIKKHKETIIDPRSAPGQDFLAAKHHHISNAWGKVVELYRSAGQEAEADQARERMQRMMLDLAVL